jgi:putative aldouronate transport system permease protein
MVAAKRAKLRGPSASYRLAQSWKRHKLLYLMMIPGIVWALTFCYGPMFGIYMAFVNYVPKGNFFTTFFQQKFVGLQWFKFFFTTGDFGRIMRNTLMTSVITLAFSFPAPIVLALLLNECRLPKFKKFVQTASYLPFFISWVICANIFLTMMASTGFVNDVLIRLGFIKEPILFFQKGELFWVLMGLANTWKGMGYNAIIYLAAITSISQDIYESAVIDGANRLQRVFYITLPCLLPTVAVMFVLAVGGLLDAGFQQQLLMSNSTIINYSDVIDTYAYRYGFGSGMYSYSAAVGLFKSVVNFILVVSANFFVSKMGGRALV